MRPDTLSISINVEPSKPRDPATHSTRLFLLERAALNGVASGSGDRSYPLRKHTWCRGARLTVRPKIDEAPVASPTPIHDNRQRKERPWIILDEWRAAATRDQKTVASFIGFLQVSANLAGIRSDH